MSDVQDFGAFTRTRQHGPIVNLDRVPRTVAKFDQHAGSTSVVHTRLHGAVTCTAHSIGPLSVRMGNTTLILTDRRASHALVMLHLFFTDVTRRLGSPVILPPASKRTGQVAAVVEISGSTNPHGSIQRVNRRAEASLNVGPARITACDRQASEAIATAATQAYDMAQHLYTGLQPMEVYREAHRTTKLIETPLAT